MANLSDSLTVLPNVPLFQRMLEHATARPFETIIFDKGLGIEANYIKIFADLLHMRDVIQKNTQSPTGQETTFVSLLIPVNYEFIICVLAILASGRAFVPIRFGHNAKYALESIQRCKSNCMIYSPEEEDLAMEIQQLATASGHRLDILPFQLPTTPPPNELSDLGLHLDTQTPVSLETPAMVTFSSGTTGIKPKGIVHSWRFFSRPWRLPPFAVFLLVTDPFHLISYLNAMITPFLGGCKLQIITQEQGAAEIWEQMRSGRITSFSALPGVWEDMAWYYRNHIQDLPREVRETYLAGVKRVIYPYSMGLVTPSPVLRFWSDIGRPLLNAFGATELGGLALSTTAETESDHYRCIGKPSANVAVKLSEGNSGELLVKSPTAMLGYLDDPERTKSVYDEDGFYRTGDAASALPNGEYIYEGRIDKPAKDPIAFCERALSRLPYVDQVVGAMLPFEHEYATHMAGLVVRIKPGSSVPTGPSGSEKAKDLSKAQYRLSISVYGCYLQLDSIIPVAVRVLGPSSDSKNLDRKDVECFLPYDKDPSFRADIEYAVHRACLN